MSVPAPVHLRATGLYKRFGDRDAVTDVSLDVAPGRIAGVFGPNGAGKTTCFRILAGLLRPDAGHVWFGGEDVTVEPLFRRARRGMGYLAQEPSVFRGLSVEDNLALVLEIAGVSRKEIPRRVARWIEEMALASVRRDIGATLSGGERRRVEIARVLALEPALLILDEPFAGLDPRGIEDLKRRLAGMAAEGVGILLTDHNQPVALQICHEVYRMEDGRLAAVEVVDPPPRVDGVPPPEFEITERGSARISRPSGR